MSDYYRRAVSEQYMNDVAERFARVLARTGVKRGPLAKLFAMNFVGHAKLGGRTKEQCHRLIDELWETVEPSEEVVELPQ